MQGQAARVGAGEPAQAILEIRRCLEGRIHQVEVPDTRGSRRLDDGGSMILRKIADSRKILAVVAVPALGRAAAHGLEVHRLVGMEAQRAGEVGVGQGGQVEEGARLVSPHQGAVQADIVQDAGEGKLALALYQGVEGRALQKGHARHDFGAAGDEPGAGQQGRGARGDVHAAFQVPCVEGKGHQVGFGSCYGFRHA